MALLGFVPFPGGAGAPVRAIEDSASSAISASGDKASDIAPSSSFFGFGLEPERQPRFVHNKSRRFESRFASLRIDDSPAIMLKGMAGSVLGVHVAHGEGHALFPDASVLDACVKGGLAPLRYADDEGNATEAYPFNPNGSPQGIAGLCSPCGRHLALMPHPERCFLKWQWPWMPSDWESDLVESPWLQLFQNARQWCEDTRFQQAL